MRKTNAGETTAAPANEWGQGWQSYPAGLAGVYRVLASEMRALGDEEAATKWEKEFAESRDSFHRDVYKECLRDIERGRFKNEAAFLECVKKESLESYAIEDGYDLDNPSEETFPEWAKLHEPKTPEEDAFETGKLAHELNGMMIGDRIAGPIGSAIGGAIDSFFGLFAGAAEASTINRLSRA